jgi:dTDP-4-dehydrorhamnose 3,5-epimerase
MLARSVLIRLNSPTFRFEAAMLLGDSDRRSVYISEGLAHGFLVLSDPCVVEPTGSG